MGVITSFLKLFKPAPNDYVDVEKHLNENYDKIDTWAKDLVVNDLTTGGADKALSGEMGKKIWTDRNKTNTYTASNNKGEYYGEFQGNYDGARLALQRTDGGSAEFIGMTIGGTTGNTGLTRPIFRQRVSNNVGELSNNTFELFHQGNYDKNKLMLGNMGIDSLIYIQDNVIKEAGNGYVDKPTGKLYYCYKTTTSSITTPNKDYFVLATNIELRKLFEPKTHKVSFFGVQELEFTRIGNVVYVFMQYTTRISSIPNNSKVNEGNLLPIEFRPKKNVQWILQGNSSQGDTYSGTIAVLTDGLIEIYTRNSATLSNAGLSTLATYLAE